MRGMHLLPGEASKILRRPLFAAEVELNGASHLLLWNRSPRNWSGGEWRGKIFSRTNC